MNLQSPTYIRRQILNYFRENPCAMDTARGIARWWVGSCPKAVEHELECMVQEGILEKIGDGERTLYRYVKGRCAS